MTQNETVLVLPSPTSEVYHTDPDCRAMNASHRDPVRKPRSMINGKSWCRYCSGAWGPHGAGWDNSQCRDCGGLKTNGVCEFCEAFDDIHGVPRNAELAADGGEPT